MSLKNEFVSLLKKYGLIQKDASEEQQEEMISYEVVYEPDTVDTHGQWMSRDTVEKACENFNKNLETGVVKSNLFHVLDTENFSVVDTWIQKEFDVTVDGTNQPIKAGTWVAKLQFHDKDLWELKKAGVLGGVSIGAKGVLDEETGELTNITFDETLEEEDE